MKNIEKIKFLIFLIGFFVLLLNCGVYALESNFGDKVIVMFEEEVDVSLFQENFRRSKRFKTAEQAEVLSEALNIYYMDKEEAEYYQKLGLDVLIEEDEVIYLLSAPNDPYYSYQNYYSLFNIDKLKEHYGDGTGVRIGVIDSGVSYTHEDLKDANIAEGYNYVSNNTDATDKFGHGTNVIGLISATPNNKKGIAGIASGAEVVPLKVTDGKTLLQSDLVKAIDDAVNKYDCKIINMSLGASSELKSVERLVNEYTEEYGVIFIAAGGNGDKSGKPRPNCDYPARYENVIAVGGVTSNLEKFPAYDYGTGLNVMMLGNSVYTTLLNGGYGTNSGTSFAAPIVSAITAILVANNPDFDFYDINEVFKATTKDVGDSGWDMFYGYGLVDAYECYNFITDPNIFYFYPEPTAANKLKIYSKESVDSALLVRNIVENRSLVDYDIEEIILDSDKLAYIDLPASIKKSKYFIIESLETLKSLSKILFI